jgi:hypothetical protein
LAVVPKTTHGVCVRAVSGSNFFCGGGDPALRGLHVMAWMLRTFRATKERAMTTEDQAPNACISNWTLATGTRPHQREVHAPVAPETIRIPAQEATRE